MARPGMVYLVARSSMDRRNSLRKVCRLSFSASRALSGGTFVPWLVRQPRHFSRWSPDWIHRISRILVLVASGTFYSILQAQDLPSEESVEKVQWQGEALVEVGPFGLDVYIARFFDSGTGLKLIELEYLRDVMRKFSMMGWDKGLAVFDTAVYRGCRRLDKGEDA